MILNYWVNEKTKEEKKKYMEANENIALIISNKIKFSCA